MPRNNVVKPKYAVALKNNATGRNKNVKRRSFQILILIQTAIYVVRAEHQSEVCRCVHVSSEAERRQMVAVVII